MDIFVEIVSNPDGFAFTHSMVRASGKEGVRGQLGEERAKVVLASRSWAEVFRGSFHGVSPGQVGCSVL